MSDNISREAALKLILSGRVGDDSPVECPEECNSMLEWAADEVAKMPAADVPDRKVGDMISRQAAIEEIARWIGYIDEDMILRIQTGLKKLPPEKPERWIPVSERLPEIGEHYVSEPCIVYCSNGAYGFAELEENIFGQVGWNCERDDEYHEPLGEVLAWMPLPEPWKGEEE